jgi:hypothetical protein
MKPANEVSRRQFLTGAAAAAAAFTIIPRHVLGAPEQPSADSKLPPPPNQVSSQSVVGRVPADGQEQAATNRPFSRVPTDPPSLVLTPGREFAGDSYVHKPLAADAPLDGHSAEYVAEMRRQIRTFYGTVNVNFNNFSPPVYQVGPDQPTVRVKVFDKKKPDWTFNPLQEMWLSVPLPDGFKVSPGTDMEAVVYQPSTGRYWEFWLMQKTGAKTKDSTGREVDEWGARWGGYIADLKTNPGYYVTPKEGYKFGTAATGLPLLAGLITIDEQLRGEVDHAVHFALVETLNWDYWSHPAQRSDGYISPQKNPYAVPEGAIFRLPADLDLDKIEMTPYARMIAKAVQKHGMVVRDKGGAVVFYAENPAGRYAMDPYKWIFRGRNEKEERFPAYLQLTHAFPWDKLQMLALRMNKPIPAATEESPKAPLK